MNLSISWYTDPGKRKRNEDWISVNEYPNGFACVVSDGYGGGSRGSLAALMAGATTMRELPGEAPNKNTLMKALWTANYAVLSGQGDSRPIYASEAVLWIGNGRFLAANVGDCRVYHIRNGRILRRTMDHSIAQLEINAGRLRERDARRSDRNLLTRSLGTPNPPKAGLIEGIIRPGDRFLICTNGFWTPVGDNDLLDTIPFTGSAQQWLTRMRRILQRKRDPRQDCNTAACVLVNKA